MSEWMGWWGSIKSKIIIGRADSERTSKSTMPLFPTVSTPMRCGHSRSVANWLKGRRGMRGSEQVNMQGSDQVNERGSEQGNVRDSQQVNDRGSEGWTCEWASLWTCRGPSKRTGKDASKWMCERTSNWTCKRMSKCASVGTRKGAKGPIPCYFPPKRVSCGILCHFPAPWPSKTQNPSIEADSHLSFKKLSTPPYCSPFSLYQWNIPNWIDSLFQPFGAPFSLPP